MLDEKKVSLRIRNPEIPILLLAGILTLVGALLFAIPYIKAQFGVYGFYFKYFGGIFFLLGLFMLYHYGKKFKDFNHLLDSDEEKIIWLYDDDRYESYVDFIYKSKEDQQGNKRKLLILFLMTLALMAVLFFTLPQDEKFMAYAFAIGMFSISVSFIYIIPLLEMRRVRSKPYCTIMMKDEAYCMGTYHQWKECRAKVKEGLIPGVTVLSFTYTSITADGKMTREWHALLPSEGKESVEEAQQMVLQINRKKKKKEKNPEKKRSFLDRLILKALNRDQDH